MADNNNNLKVTIEGDNASLVAALVEAEARIAKFTAKKQDVDALSEAFEHLSIKSIAQAAIGFGTLAGAAEKTLGLIIEGIKSIIEIIPKSIENTGKLVENYKQLSITAGMSTREFNEWVATIALAGGKTEDLNDIVKGMERGIKQHSEALVANSVFTDENALKHATLGEYIHAVVSKMESYGDATSRDQLLLDAFGKSGLAFAAILKEIDERREEGKNLGNETNIITNESIKLQKELTKAKGETDIQEKLSQKLISDGSIQHSIALEKIKTDTLKYANETIIINDAINKGLIKRSETTIEVIGNDRQLTKTTVENREEEKKALESYLSSMEKARIENEKMLQIELVRAGLVHSSGLSYDPQKAEKDKKAAEERQKAAEAHREAVKSATEAQTRENILLKEGELAAFRYDLALKGIIGTEQDKIVAQKAANDAIKEQNKNDIDMAKEQEERNNKWKEINKRYDQEKLAGEKEIAAARYTLLEQDISNRAKLGIISATQELTQLKALDTLKYNEEVKAINDSITLRKAAGNIDIAEEQKLKNDIQKLTLKHNQEQNKLTLELAKEQNKYYTTMWNSAESAASKAISSMILEHQKLGQAIKSIFQSILSSVVNVFADMAAKSIISSIQEAVGYKAAAATKAASALDTATAESYSAYAYIPFAGMALAEAQIAAITSGFTASSAANQAITAHATGGLVTSPTLSLMGEAGPELIAPKHDFMEVTRQLVASGASMYRAIVQSQAYQGSSNSYSPASGATPGGQAVHVNLSGAVIAGESVESSRLIGNMIQKHLNSYGRRNN